AAMRSAAAARVIKALIADSVARVGEGSERVDRAGRNRAEIVVSVQRVTDIMGEISSASREQSEGIVQVGATVQQLDGATQQNAALVEEASAAARSLQEQARALSRDVARFVLDDAPAAAPASAPAGTRVRAADTAATAPAPRPAAPPPVATPRIAAPRPQPALAATGAAGGEWLEF